MTTVTNLGYLAVGVDNMNEAVEYYTRFVRLEVTEQIGRTVFLTGGPEHHWVRLEEGGSGVKRVGYQVADDQALDDARAQLDAIGIKYAEGGNPKADRVQRWLRFCDPGGTAIELFAGMYERGVAPLGTGITMEKFLHAAWATSGFEATTAFYQNVLGFKASDWVEDRAGFFRAANRYHHSLVLIRSERPAFNHFCIQVESLDDVMRARHNAVKAGVKLRDDLLRHAPSGSIGFYMKDEARGYAVEFCIGHPRLDDETHRPRVLPSVPQTLNVWTAELPYRPGARPGGPGTGETWAPGTEPTGNGGRQLVGS